MADRCQQFRFEQFHLLEGSIFHSCFQFMDTFGQQHVHEHCPNCLHNKWQQGSPFLRLNRRLLSILLLIPAQEHHCL